MGQVIAVLVSESVFHFVITKSKSGIAELDLFFPEPPDRARLFGTLRPIKFQKFVVPELEVQNSCLKMSTPLIDVIFNVSGYPC